MPPAKLQSLLQAAVGHHRAGRLDEAEQMYRRVRAVAPRNFDLLHLSGLLAYQQSRLPEAIDLLGRAHQTDPRHHVCRARYAMALLAGGRTADAEKHLRDVVAAKPDFHEGWEHLAYCLKTQDRIDAALACSEKVVHLQPRYAAGWYQHGLTLSLVGRCAEALTCHERALEVDPGYALARYGRAQALHQANRIDEAVAAYAHFLEVQPKHFQARSDRLYALHNLDGVSREELFAQHVAYGRIVGPEPRVQFSHDPAPDRRLRVGILSPDLRAHSCAYFLEPLLQNLDRRQFEIYLYHDHFREDEVSARLRKLAATWRKVVGVPDRSLEKIIRTDAPDILIDLSGHTGMSNRLPLFARRLAPVQMTYLGYPDTTGLASMDFRLTDAVADPVGDADEFATERLVRFAPTAWAYAPPADAPAVSELPRVSRGQVTFGCFNSLSKLTDRALATWARILTEVPDSRLLLKGRGLGEPETRGRFETRLARCGLPAERVELVERVSETAAHLALYHRVDIALDTFPYHGTTTTCEALWMGVPIVTLAGDRHSSRVGCSLLTAAGHPEWIASTTDDYVRIARELAADGGRLAQCRAGLRSDLRRGPLLDHAGQGERFGAALRECWMAWCEKSSPVVGAVG